MIKKWSILFPLMPVVFLSACAIGPKYDISGVDFSNTPQRVVEGDVAQGTQVLWGGLIISSANLKSITRFEILAYPLDSNQKPRTDEMPLGRFLAQHEGYLEIADYAQGRIITVAGKVLGKTIGTIDKSEYTYPVVNIDRHYLWGRRGNAPESSIHFGIGVMLHN